MDSNKHPVRSFVIALVILGVLGYGIFLALSLLLAQLASVTSDLGKAIVAAGATVVIATFSLVFGKIWEQKVKLQEEVRQRKLPVYEAHVQFLFNTIYSQTKKAASTDEEKARFESDVMDGFRIFTGQILVWGGSNVIKTWTAFRLHDWNKNSARDGFIKFEAFIKALRDELGNKNTNLGDGDLMKLFVNDFDADRAASVPKVAPSEGETPTG